jgi:hypothetical protein
MLGSSSVARSNSAKICWRRPRSMPCPLSRTAISISSRPAERTVTSTLPAAVNFKALCARFPRICWSRVGSAHTVSSSASTCQRTITGRPARAASTSVTTSSISGRSATSRGTTVSCADDAAARSMTSRNRLLKYVPARRTCSRSSRCERVSGPSSSCSSTSVKPRMALSGVRSSWLTAMRKADFSRSMSSTDARISRSRARLSSSTRRKSLTTAPSAVASWQSAQSSATRGAARRADSSVSCRVRALTTARNANTHSSVVSTKAMRAPSGQSVPTDTASMPAATVATLSARVRSSDVWETSGTFVSVGWWRMRGDDGRARGPARTRPARR